MKKIHPQLIFKIALFGYTIWLTFFYRWGFLSFLGIPGYGVFWTARGDICTEFDFLILPLLFLPLLFLSLIFQLLNFVTENIQLSKNSLMVSLGIFGTWSFHDLMQLIFNNKSAVLLTRPPLLTPLVPLLFAFLIYWFIKNQAIQASPHHRLITYFMAVARIIYFVILAISLSAVLYHHSTLIDSALEYGRFVSEYNCGVYSTPPGYISPPDNL